LLVFDAGYAAWRSLTRNRPHQSPSDATLPGYRAIGPFVLVLAVSSYLIRIVVPLGIPVLQFPSLAYLPQYVSLFALGIVASRRNWLQTIPSSMGKIGLAIALVATLVLFPISLRGGHFLGGGYWQSGVYALWDSTFSVGMCLALIAVFRRFFNHQGRRGRFLTQHAFTVYFIHAPVITFLALALRGIQLEHLLKFGLAAILGVPVCFAVAFVVRSNPLASRIL
jgi:glucans biosynthesis protein C